MKLSKLIFLIFIAAFIVVFLSSCNNCPAHIPFPENETDFPQPVSKPLKFSAVKKLHWSNDVTPLKPVIKKFDFDKLLVKVYDTSAFVPFAHKPDSVKFDYDKLPDTAFDYNKLPTISLKFETSILEPPPLIQSGPPRLIEGNTNLISELGESAGLKCNYINSIFEDKTGFLWIATDNGLYRYDGGNLLLYSHIRANFLRYNMVEDARGQIWMAIQNDSGKNNVILIDPKAGIIKQVINSKGFGYSGTIEMLLDDKGRIWVTTYPVGVTIIDENSGTIKQYYFPRYRKSAIEFM